MLEKAIAWAIALTVTTFCFFGAVRGCAAEADTGAQLEEVAAGIAELQPAAAGQRANRLAAVFAEAGRRHNHDPLLLVAIAFRESSLAVDVEEHRRRGALGEGGLMQVHGAALRARPHYCPLPLPDAECQVQTGAAWLAYARAACGGSWWRWVAAYGLGACPSEERAREHAAARVAHRYYTRIGGTRWD